MDNVVYDKKCIKSVNFSYSFTTVTKETQSHTSLPRGDAHVYNGGLGQKPG